MCINCCCWWYILCCLQCDGNDHRIIKSTNLYFNFQLLVLLFCCNAQILIYEMLTWTILCNNFITIFFFIKSFLNAIVNWLNYIWIFSLLVMRASFTYISIMEVIVTENCCQPHKSNQWNEHIYNYTCIIVLSILRPCANTFKRRQNRIPMHLKLYRYIIYTFAYV